MSKEVLIVDDDRTLVRSLERAISEEGYPVRVVHDGESALREVRQQLPGLVLLDLLIPGKDGRAVLRKLRESEDTKDLPVIAMSGIFRGRSHAIELEKAGAQSFLEKPFRRTDLLPLLRRHLGRPPRKEQAPAEALANDSGGVSLVEEPVARLIWQAMQGKSSGALVFESGKRRKTLLLREGQPLQIGSNVARETLGNRLLAAGKIDSAAMQESLRRARSGEGRQGEVLVRMGAVSQSEVDRALVTQAEEKILDLFSWNDGEMTLQPDLSEVPRASSLEGWTARELILRGVQLMSLHRVERELGPYREERLERSKLGLEPREASLPAVAAVLRELDDEETTVGRVASDYAAVLYGLHLVGALRFGDEPEPGAVRERPAGLPGPDELRERCEAQSEMNHLQVMGLSSDASEDALRKAFLGLARRFHPDRFSGEEPGTRELAGEVFARIAEANEVLSDSVARGVYLEALRKGKSSKVDPRQVSQIVQAESLFGKGEALFKKREYVDALQQFREALDLNPGEGDFHAFYGWTYYLARREQPDAEDVARRHLEQALELAPNSAGAHYLGGLLRKACGDKPGAERMFRKVIELAPSHVEAARELRLLTLRKDSKSEGIRGMFGIGRKKG